MKLQVSAFLIHKLKETFEDCFDRYSISDTSDRFIVADGVSNSFFPEIWADLLCKAFIRYQGEKFDPKNELPCIEVINDYRDQWFKAVSVEVSKPDVKYYTKRKFQNRDTAACAFAGFRLIQKKKFFIETVSLGDCCTFVFKKTKTGYKKAFSSLKSDYVFNNFPHYIDSKKDEQFGEVEFESFNLSEMEEGLIVMASDALAKWVFTYYENDVFTDLCNIASQEDFFEFVEKYRNSGEFLLENDDVVLLKIKFSEAANLAFESKNETLFIIDDHLKKTSSPPDDSENALPPIEETPIEDSLPDASALAIESTEDKDHPIEDSENSVSPPDKEPSDATEDKDALIEDLSPKASASDTESANPIDKGVDSYVSKEQMIVVESERISSFEPIEPIKDDKSMGQYLEKNFKPDPKWDAIARQTFILLADNKESKLITLFGEIAGHKKLNIFETIKMVINYEMSDEEKLRLIETLIEANKNTTPI